MPIIIKDKNGDEKKRVDFETFRHGGNLTKYEKALLNNKLLPGVIRIYPDKFAVSVDSSEEFALIVFEEDNTRLRFSKSKEELSPLSENYEAFPTKIAMSNKRTKYDNRYFFDFSLYERRGEGIFSLLSADDAFVKIGDRMQPNNLQY